MNTAKLDTLSQALGLILPVARTSLIVRSGRDLRTTS
jgi:hypothetical protein